MIQTPPAPPYAQAESSREHARVIHVLDESQPTIFNQIERRMLAARRMKTGPDRDPHDTILVIAEAKQWLDDLRANCTSVADLPAEILRVTQERTPEDGKGAAEAMIISAVIASTLGLELAVKRLRSSMPPTPRTLG